MIRTFLALFLCISSVAVAENSPRKIAFARRSALHVGNLDGTGARKVATGAAPDLSPDGTRLVFNTEDTTGKTPERAIAIADVATGKATKVPNIPSNSCHSPVWSPDGKRLLFQIYADGDWHVGLINADGTEFKYAKRAESKGRSVYCVSWAADGNGFYCQDLDNIYHFDLNGALQKQWKVAELFPRGGMSSGCRLAVSPDGTTLLVDVEMDEEVTRKNWDGPPPSIWAVNLSTSKATRVTPKGVFAWEPSWIDAQHLVCMIQPASADEPSLYRVSMDGKTRELVFKSARDPSVSRQP